MVLWLNRPFPAECEVRFGVMPQNTSVGLNIIFYATMPLRNVSKYANAHTGGGATPQVRGAATRTTRTIAPLALTAQHRHAQAKIAAWNAGDATSIDDEAFLVYYRRVLWRAARDHKAHARPKAVRSHFKSS